MKVILRISTLLLIINVFLVRCENSNSSSSNDDSEVGVNDTVSNSMDDDIEKPVDEEADQPPKDPIDFTKMIANKIMNSDFKNWSAFSDETIFFSPYAFIDTNTLVRISTTTLNEIYLSEEKLNWGVQDGTGDTIRLDFNAYTQRYINDFDLMDTSAVNYSLMEEPISRGNELHNVNKLYPDAFIVEAHKSANDDMGMNWRSLLFVIRKNHGKLELIGLIHNEWTI